MNTVFENNVTTHTWVSNGKTQEIKCHLYFDLFQRLYYTNLLGGEFANTYGQGKTPDEAIASLKIRLFQLRAKK